MMIMLNIVKNVIFVYLNYLMEQLKAILDKPGQSVDLVFSGNVLKANLDSLNNKKVWTGLGL